MAQKLILCEGMVNTDILSNPKIAAAVAAGLEVTSASGFATPDNRYMCLVLLSEPAEEPSGNNAPANAPASGGSGEGGEGGES